MGTEERFKNDLANEIYNSIIELSKKIEEFNKAYVIGEGSNKNESIQLITILGHLKGNEGGVSITMAEIINSSPAFNIEAVKRLAKIEPTAILEAIFNMAKEK